MPSGQLSRLEEQRASGGLHGTPIQGQERSQEAIYSQNKGASSMHMDGTQIDQHEKKSAAFGDLSSMDQRGSQQDFIDKSDAVIG